ncbi:MAG: glycosyltransferase [Alphaproteobacteria bacterium]|nr:glycosyltransferase [Alphaproteobacteria bacterium]
MRVLFLFERWRDGNPARGESALDSIFVNTFREYADLEIAPLFYDEFRAAHPQETTAHLIGHIGRARPEAILYCPVPAMRELDRNFRLEVLDVIRDNLPVKTALLALDTNIPHFASLLVSYSRFADLVITCDGGNPALANRYHAPSIDLWTPVQQPTGPLKPLTSRQFTVSFCGTVAPYPDRVALTESLRPSAGRAFVHDIAVKPPLPYDRFLRVLEQSAATINLSNAYGGADQLKGRIFEGASRGAVVFEQRNRFTADYFDPDAHLVAFDSIEEAKDLLVRFDPAEHAARAEACHAHWQAHWSGTKFWEKAMATLAGA